MRFFRTRKANIDPTLRKDLELWGKEVVAMTLSGAMPAGGSALIATNAQHLIYAYQDQARLWLREKRDEEERRETWNLALEIAIVVLIVVEIMFRFFPVKGN